MVVTRGDDTKNSTGNYKRFHVKKGVDIGLKTSIYQTV